MPHAALSSASLVSATIAPSWPAAPGLTPPGPSPSSPLVQVTSTVRIPSAAYRANTPPVLDDSSSGWACTAISVSGSVIPTACRARGCSHSWRPHSLSHRRFPRAGSRQRRRSSWEIEVEQAARIRPHHRRQRFLTDTLGPQRLQKVLQSGCRTGQLVAPPVVGGQGAAVGTDGADHLCHVGDR